MADTKPQVTDAVASDQADPNASTKDTVSESNLVQLAPPNGNSPLTGLSEQISELEALLQQISAKQQAADSEFRELHTQTQKLQGNLGTHLELTNKKLMAVLEKYTALNNSNEQLGKTTRELQTSLSGTRDELRSELQQLESNSQAQLKNLSETTRELLQQQFEETQQRHADLLQQLDSSNARLASLDKKAERFENELSGRITALQSTVNAAEQRLQQELQRIEQEAVERNKALEEEAQRLQKVDEQQAEALQQLSADTESLAQRADNVEARTDQLETETKALSEETHKLHARADELSQQTNTLKARTHEMDARADAHEQRTTHVEQSTEQLEETAQAQQGQLLALATGLRNQLHGFSGILILVVLAIGILALFLRQGHEELNTVSAQQQNSSEALSANIASQQAQLDESLNQATSDLQQTLQAEHQTLSNNDKRLQLKIDENQRLLEEQQKTVVALKHHMVNLQDKADSVNGRLSALYPMSNYATDSTLHGPAWLKQQDPQQSMVRVAIGEDKAALYQLINRWSFYLDEAPLAYLPVEHGYNLLYGPFEQTQAELAARRMPSADLSNPPKVISISQLIAD